MDWAAHNAGFVEAAYAISAFCIIALAFWIWRQDRLTARLLKNLKN